MINKRNIVVIIAMVMLLSVGSVFAYFTDTQVKTNNFTVGNISIDLIEPNWDPENGKNIVPEQDIAKDPQVTNDGANDAYVFLQVTVPTASVKTANADGTVNAAAKKELFTYNVNNDWTRVKKTDEADGVTYIYAYIGADGNMKALAPGVTTQAVFNSVKFINIIEGQLDNQNIAINIQSMGIQADDIKVSAPTDVYNLLTVQSK